MRNCINYGMTFSICGTEFRLLKMFKGGKENLSVLRFFNVCESVIKHKRKNHAKNNFMNIPLKFLVRI